MALTATDDNFTFKAGSASYTGNFLSNDSPGINGQYFLRNVDGNTVLAKKPGQITEIKGDFGTFFVKSDGSFEYKLNSNLVGDLPKGQSLTESISYKISDGTGKTDYALAKINIVSSTPLAVDDNFTFAENASISGNITADDKPGFNGTILLRSVEGTSIVDKPGANDPVTEVKGDFGTFSFKPDGSYTYQLTTDIADGQSVTEQLKYYKISDGEGHTDVGIANITINAVDGFVGGAVPTI